MRIFTHILDLMEMHACLFFSGQFQLFDTDSDNIVNETESRLILESMVETQKIVLAEIFALHVCLLLYPFVMALLHHGIRCLDCKLKCVLITTFVGGQLA
jgi:hypothetical protein